MSATDHRRHLSVAVYPGLEPRLLRGDLHVRETLSDYVARGGYCDAADPSRLMQAIGRAGLRGRGGAGFPLYLKLAAVRTRGSSPVVIANGEEGEPVSLKDRWLLRYRPHAVLDGLRLVARLVEARRSYVYVSDEHARQSVQSALDEISGCPWWEVDVQVAYVDPSYVAGEASAAAQWIDGGPPVPTDKPPRPFERGVDGLPTLVSNVETLAHVPQVQRMGPRAYRSVGTRTSPGTFLLTLGGPGGGLLEVPFGVTLGEILAWRCKETAEPVAVLLGGYSGGIFAPSALDMELEYDAAAAAGGSLGCGAIVPIRKPDCPVGVVASIMSYFARNNAGQCGSCVNGTRAMADALESLRNQSAGPEERERLRRWAAILPGRGACQLLDGAALSVTTLLREFPALVEEHLEARCSECQDAPFEHPAPYSTAAILDPAMGEATVR